MSDASRRRRFRARQRDGLAVIPVEVPYHDTIDALLQTEFLTETDSLDGRKVAAALSAFVVEWGRRWKLSRHA